MPPNPWPFLDHPGPLAFAHRGGAGAHPENTMPAFEHAVDLGYRYLETDVHVTSDGVLVAFHDEALDRVTDRRGAISGLTWSEVSEARVAGREPVPRLDELLAAWPEVRVNLDPKHDAAVVPLVRLLQDLSAIERVCVGSFSEDRLTRIRELAGSRLCTSLGPAGTARLVAAGWRLPVRSLPAPCAQVPVRHGRVPIVTPRFVAAAHRRGIQVHVWTIDDPLEMDRLLDLGVDGLMTDQPAVLRGVLERRGSWVPAP